MPYRKIKQESYNSLGGIDNKISQFLNSPVEFLQLENLDFQIPGSLSLRWGSTYYVGQTLVGKITGLEEYITITGSSYVVVTGQSQAFTVTGASLTQFYSQVQHASFLNYINHINTTKYGLTAPWIYNLGASYNYDFQVMNDWLFACNGVDFWKFNGQSTYFFGLEKPYDFDRLGGDVSALWYNSGFGQSNSAGALSNGTYYFQVDLVNNRGAIGQASVMALPNFSVVVAATNTIISFAINGAIWPIVNPGYGVSYAQLYVHWEPTDTTNTFKEALFSDFNLVTDVNGDALKMVPGTTYNFVNPDQIGVTTLVQNTPYGRWYFPDNYYGPVDFYRSGPETLPIRVPQFIENYSTRMWLAGMTAVPSSLYFSDFSEPEQVGLDSVIEVRTEDGGAISGLKAFSGGLVIFKENSFHALTGDDPTNFVLRQLSNEYGCINNRAIAQFQDVLIFLDRKGIIQYNGSNIDIISTKIDPILKRMNLNAAKIEACMTYDKLRNEVLCDIPIDGSQFNNITLVYDIIQKAWTTYKYGSYTPASTAIIRGRLDNFYAFSGGYSGTIVHFGPSFLTDSGSGISYLVGSRFHTEEGNSITKQYRRLFINTSTAGSTVPLDIEFFKDFSSSSVLSRTMYQGAFQQRIDFGIPSKSLAFTLSGVSTTEKMVFHGYTLEHRFQRAV